MNKENFGVGELSDEQKARITRNFRAAKVLLDRKRPRDASNASISFPRKIGIMKEVETPSVAGSVNRVPLYNISVNTPTPIMNPKLNQSGCPSSSHFKVSSVGKSDGGLFAGTRVLPDENEKAHSHTPFQTPIRQINYTGSSFQTPVRHISYNGSSCAKGIDLNHGSHTPNENRPSLDSFETPIRPVDCNVTSSITPMRHQPCSSFDEFSTIMPTIFDEEFDECFLAEIDELCESRTKSKQLTEESSCDVQLKKANADRNNYELKANLSPVGLENFQSDNISDGSSEALKFEGMPDEYAKYLQSLNDRQREAACSDISIPLMIVAGPGSGKTSTMVGRVLMLLHKGIEASNILAMTFTTAAASEMRDRIGSVAGKTAAKELMISTFHSFSLQLCRLHAEKLGRTTEFLVYGQGQQRKAVIEAVRLSEIQISESDKLCEESNVTKRGPEDFREKSKKWMKFVAQAKASGKTFQDCQKSGNAIGAAILTKYEEILQSCNALDYHDLISCSVKLLTDFPEVFKECQESWQAVVVDEFQDTSTMQYDLLRILASHKRITIVGDEDQSIFSFNGADVSGFKSFRSDFQPHKEVRLNKNYRSTRCIVEAASFLIQNNSKRCQLNKVLTDNSSGSKITVKECCNEDAQCSFVVDKILELTSSSVKGTFGEIAVLYRRQVSGKMFQTAFRERKIPFNVHGVAFYRKKVVRAILSMLKTTLVACDDGSYKRVFKALLPLEKDEKKKVIEHIDKVSSVRKCSFISAASDIFSAKISGVFTRSHLTRGRKVLVTLDMISKLVHREQSISAVITSVANLIPQKYVLEQRAVVDVDGGRLLNEEHDLRSVLQYLLDDVSEFLKSYNFDIDEKDKTSQEKGCVNVLKSFIDFITERETENFRARRQDNNHAVTLTTIHQSKGLEWDTVFIVKANESEIPLLHEFNGITKDKSASLEEERRLLYVAVTRARKKLFILYVTMDSNWQILQPSRFLKEIPNHLFEIQDESSAVYMQGKHQNILNKNSGKNDDPVKNETDETNSDLFDQDSKDSSDTIFPCNGNDFLKRFSSEERAHVSHLFHRWAKKAAFKEPKRLLNKVAFVIDERLSAKKCAQKDVLRSLKECLKTNEAFQYAENVLQWLQIPADKRAYITREKQEHFQKLRIETAMDTSEPTSKQIAYLQSLGCTTVPTSRLHASRLIEQYKSL